MTYPPKPDLVVGRDRAHVKVLIEEYPCAEVISASAFFDKVRMLAFLKDRLIKRDDYAPTIFATRFLEKNSRYPLRFASNFSSLYSSCYHGTSSPREILPEIQGQVFEFLPIFEVLAKIDMAMNEASLVSGVSALYRSWQAIRNEQLLPPSLATRPVIFLRHLIDLTLLEIEVIKDLSRLGVTFDICFPLDFQERGINAAVDFSAKQFERSLDLNHIELSFDNIAKNGPLAPLINGLFKDHESVSLPKENCSVNQASDVVTEANLVASKIAEILTASPMASVAVAVRSIDGRSKIYKHALLRHGINVKDRKGIPLPETPAGLLLATLFSAKLSSLPRRDVISLINHPLFSLHINDVAARAKFIKLLQQLGIDDRLLPSLIRRYERQIERFSATVRSDDKLMQDLLDLKNWLNNTEDLLGILPDRASFLGHLNGVLSLIDKAFLADDPAVACMKSTISSFSLSVIFDDADPVIIFSDFASLLEDELSKITIPRPDNEDLNAVEFLLLPELLCRSFDHVFIADISFGRMPQNSKPDPLIDDEARIALNSIFKKPLLRVFFDDPFEPLPVPPRQALEPFWFASAVAAAKTSVHFSCAMTDENGLEQAPSEFFMWLMNNVDMREEITSYLPPTFARPEELRFFQGLSEKLGLKTHTGSYHQVLSARKSAFAEKIADDFAFRLPSQFVIEGFDGRLGEEPNHAITPTMVEAFADCRFRGFSERILSIEKSTSDADDVDARVLGQVAHRTLEMFFKTEARDRRHVDRILLTKILAIVSKEFSDQHFIGNEEVFSCHLEWLNDALYRLLCEMEKTLGGMGRTVAQELSLGLRNSKWPPLPINVEGRRYLLGGRVDRVDKVGDDFLIIDYKLSSSTSLKSELTAKNMLTRHFQMPIYLRLVALHLANNNPSKVSFSFASIRDGELLPVMSNHNLFFSRIFDDSHEDGLGRAIDRVFAPIMHGELLATAGEHCSTCDLKFVCRKSESENHE